MAAIGELHSRRLFVVTSFEVVILGRQALMKVVDLLKDSLILIGCEVYSSVFLY